MLAVEVKLPASAAASLCVLLAVPAAAVASKPFDFEMAPRASVGAASVGVVSPKLATEHRFNLLGMRWRGRALPDIDVRVRQPGRGWSRWAALEAHDDHNPDPGRGERFARASDALWVGTGNGIQYRMNRRVPGLRIHFVNVGDRRRRARAAQEPQPDVVTRAEWGASGCPPREPADYGTVKAVNVHHTVSLNDYSPAEAPAMVLAICRYHRNSNGWDDIGYNALVDKYGVLYEGRAGGLDQPVIGAQAQGFNSETAGIASIGDHTSVGATPQTLDALARYIRWKLQVHLQPLSGPVTLRSSGGPASRYAAGAQVTVERVLGHRDTGRTACPGQLLYGQLAQLRAMVGSGVATTVPSTATRLSGALADYRVSFGEAVPVTGLLSGADGLPLAGQQVEVQVNGDGRWVTSRRVVSAADGTFATDLKPRKRMYVRMRFPGRPDLRGAFSSRLLLRLHPVIELERPRRRARVGVSVPVSGTVGPRKRFLRLVLQQHVGGRYRKVGAKTVRARRGAFQTSFVAAFRDRYRYSVVAKSDDDTDRGSTGWIPLRVR
ncbi:MAG TPA: N-acetylmuramoyl-L-alanine amidase [Thermoleophilaceae bacterium]|nr:N-acetylmuramoyl-L-alanine amidase [Thermoleophilaceae bacterium]